MRKKLVHIIENAAYMCLQRFDFLFRDIIVKLHAIKTDKNKLKNIYRKVFKKKRSMLMCNRLDS